MTDIKAGKIVSLKTENIKKLKAVHIEPDGNLVVISGKNGAGKSSVLDSIAYAFSKKSVQCSRPVRAGEEKATIICELDDLVVKRIITENGGSLIVSSKEGAKYPTPQKVLDALVGKLTFDPLEFSRMPPDKQLSTLKSLAGLNFDKQDEQRRHMYDKRTQINRELSILKSLCSDGDENENLPDKPVDVSELAELIDKTNKINDQRAKYARELDSKIEKVKRLTAELEQAENDLVGMEDPEPLQDTGALIQRMKDANSINRKIELRDRNRENKSKLEALQAKSKQLTEEMHLFDELKEKKLKNARFPVEGLGLDNNGVTYNGVPFEQACTSERIRVSVAMGLAMNPKLRVLLIRNGNDLDVDNMDLIRKMAVDADAQIWVERIEPGEDAAVIIEDGEVV